MRSSAKLVPGGAFVVNLLTPDAPHPKLSVGTGYFLLLSFRTGLPKFGIGCAKFVFSSWAVSPSSSVLARDDGFRTESSEDIHTDFSASRPHSWVVTAN
jgi:hypothetical protein